MHFRKSWFVDSKKHAFSDYLLGTSFILIESITLELIDHSQAKLSCCQQTEVPLLCFLQSPQNFVLFHECSAEKRSTIFLSLTVLNRNAPY